MRKRCAASGIFRLAWGWDGDGVHWEPAFGGGP